MKKYLSSIALILCIVLCVFAFASCGKKKGNDDATNAATDAATTPATDAKTDAATTPATEAKTDAATDVKTDAATEAATEAKTEAATDVETEPATEPVTELETEPETSGEPAHVHVAAADYEIESYPTCTTPGQKVLYCEECGAIMDTQEIDIDPEAHKIDEWDVTDPVSLFDTTGSRRGVCQYCDQTIEEELTFTPTVFEIKSTSKDNYVVKSSYENEILGSDKHFYPTEENLDGYDLFIEFSILWNHTLPDNCTGVMKTGNCGADYKSNNVTTSWMAICDEDPDSWCPYAGGFEGCDLGTVEYGPAKMVTEKASYADYPNLTGAVEGSPEWGWHRMTIQVHQDLTNADALKNDATAGATQALYKLTATYFVDGVKVAQLSYSGDGKSNGGYWQSGTGTKMEKGLFNAQSDGEGGIIYRDCYENSAPYAFISLVGKATNADNPGYLVLGDVSFTCGTEPVQSVVRVNDPAGDPTYTIVEGVEVPAKVYFQLAE